MNDVARRLDAYIRAYPFDSGDSACETVLEQLYQAYAESHESDSPEIGDGFKELEDYLCELPLEDNNVAIEEALSNAVYHKGYDIREPIEVRVLPDRIEILSHPGADRSISIEGLKNYRATSRRYRNRRIGEFLKELHLTEGRNTGFQKIIRALKANGSPMPIFETDVERTYFLTTFLIHPEFIASNKASSEAINDGLTDNEKLVLNAMKLDGAITTPKMVEMLGLPRTAVQRAIKSLKEKGFIQREGAKKNGNWIILK